MGLLFCFFCNLLFYKSLGAMANEDLVKFIWKFRLFSESQLTTVSGKLLDIVSPGEENHNAGPDFFNAKIKLEGVLWAGNVEIHVDAIDWERHGHHRDGAYNNVILHVVVRNNLRAITLDGRELETLVVVPDSFLEERFWQLQYSDSKIPCVPFINRVNMLSVQSWLDTLAAERLQVRIREINLLAESLKGDWEEVFYRNVARSFGSSLNALPFEMLAKQVPYSLLRRYSNSIVQLEALLFGQAGFLEQCDINDVYAQTLVKEYGYLQHKHNLIPMDVSLWKFAKTRPQNFPTIRIAQLAAMVQQRFPMLGKLATRSLLKEMNAALAIKTSPYWNDHFSFKHASRKQRKGMGSSMLHTIILNAVIPVLYAYGGNKGDEEIQARCLNMLEELQPEDNVITRMWEQLNVKAINALQSQALLQLFKAYCKPKKCLYCRIGTAVLTKNR